MNSMFCSIRASSAVALALLATVAASCSDATAPQEKTTSELHFLAFASSAPEIQDTTVSFYAKLGENREIRLRYVAAPGGTAEEILRFEVPGNSLDRRPDGTPFAQGDSIKITVRIADLTKFKFDFQPSGLKFSSSHPARLRIEFAHADHDVNDDGAVNAQDDSLLATAAIWRQDSADQPWVRLDDVLELELNEVQADIFSFTGYALAF